MYRHVLSCTVLCVVSACATRNLQENQGAWGWPFPQEDYDALSSMEFQLKYFDGGFVMNEEGPYRTYEDLWNEPQP